MDTLAFLSTALQPLAAKRVLDVGCGRGDLARALTTQGARVVGVDPSADSIGVARRVAPGVRFEQCSAAALPFTDATFDGCVFLNSLHHIPADAMSRALSEAARVTVPRGRVIVVEPLPEGSFFEVFRRIEDETAVRRWAQAALLDAASTNCLRRVESTIIVRSETFESFERFVIRATAADAMRREVIDGNLAEIEAAFLAQSCQVGNGFRLEQPLKVDVLHIPDRR